MNKYNVLWFDDQHKTDDLQEIADKAFDKYSIKLNGFESAEEGILELNKGFYDAVLLDARFFSKINDVSGTEDLKGLSIVWSRLNQLQGQGIVLPRFILTGQTDLAKDSTFKETYGVFYSKHDPGDLDRLFNDICTAADQRLETQIRHVHSDIFSIFTLNYLPANIEIQVLELIKAESSKNRVEIKSMLTNIRSIHESCFDALQTIGVIPRTAITVSNRFKHLSGNKSAANKYSPTTTEYQNDAIENLNKWIYFTCGKYIHNLSDESYCGYMISNYAVESLKNGILEILLWFKKTYTEYK